MVINKKIKLLILLILTVLPFSIADYTDDISAKNLSQEDSSFYEINPCRVSLVEFLLVENKSIYQDHYEFNQNDYSSIGCFGKISGVTNTKDGFSISIGTSLSINLLLQTIIWTILLSFIKKDKLKIDFSRKILFFSILSISIFYTFSIYSENRFYSKNFYYLDFDNKSSYVYIFIIFYFITDISVKTLLPRLKNVINYLPFIYIFSMVYSGANFNLLTLVIVTIGFQAIIEMKINSKFLKYLFFLAMFWIFGSSDVFNFKPDKLRGFINTTYSFNSNFFWTLTFIFFLCGLVYLFKVASGNFDLIKTTKSFQYSSITIFLFGYLGANFPFLNFLNYYISGQHKKGVTILNPFLFDDYGEKVPWRGFYTSAESLGEFYGISIILTIYVIFKFRNIDSFGLFSIVVSSFGLYFTNNRTVVVLLAVFISVFLIKSSKLPNYLSLLFLIVPVLIFLYLSSSTLGFDYEYTSNKLLDSANNYSIAGNESSFLKLSNEYLKNSSTFSLISTASFILNRSELWGIFISRFNPSFSELLFGSGPYNFASLYNEIEIQEPNSLLLPHSSVLSYLLFFGIVNLLIASFFVLLIVKRNKQKIGYLGVFMIFYVLINMIKNDVLIYHTSIFLYGFLFFYFLLNFSEENFEIQISENKFKKTNEKLKI